MRIPVVAATLLATLAAAVPATAAAADDTRPFRFPPTTDVGEQRVGTSRTVEVGFDPWVMDGVLTHVIVGGPDHADFRAVSVHGGPGRGIIPFRRETFRVTFTPSSLGPKRAWLHVEMFGGPPRGTRTELRGTGVGRDTALAPGSLAFPNTVVGKRSGVQTATLENTGVDPVTINRARVRGPFDVRFCARWPHTLQPGERCEITVRFLPGAAGPRTGQITLYDTTAGSPRSVALSGYGLPRHPPAEATIAGVRDRLATGSVRRANGTPAVRVAVLADDPEGKVCRQPDGRGGLHVVRCGKLEYAPARIAGRAWSHRLPKLPAGSYELLVRAKDRDGATVPARRPFTVD